MMLAPRKCFLVGVSLLILMHSDALAQRSGGGRFGMSPIDLLSREDVRKELELVDDQLDKIETLAEDRRVQLRAMFTELQGLNREQRMKKMRELFEKSREEVDKRVDQILLPHQAKRLKQISFQTRLRGGSTRALAGDHVAAELDISPEKREELRAKASEIELEIREKLAELRAKALADMLGMLTPEQRSKWEVLVGEPFEFQRYEERKQSDDDKNPTDE